LGASNAAAFVALGPIMATLIAVPVLGEWPSSVAWGRDPDNSDQWWALPARRMYGP